MAQTKITWERLLQVRERQRHDRWSPNYVAGIFADPKEAPGISTATILRPAKLGRREVHTLSFNETCTALLAFYNPACWEIFDQRAMSTTPRPHLLQGHAKADGLKLRPFEGTVSVTERLGTLAKHPKVRARIGARQENWPWAPFPYFADLTLCLEDESGPYVVDWPVKDKEDDFKKRGPRKGRSRPDKDDPAVVARTALQEIYNSDAGIRTHQVVGRSIDFHVRCNLREMFLDESYRTTIHEEARPDLIHELNASVGVDIPAYITARRLANSFKIQPREVVAIIKQGIWNRQIRVDLFQPVLMDKPLRPEIQDVLSHYADWFSR
ncbi:MAG: hypothetical protein KJ852_16720 [Gammaproteobacteria bacterium]|nr:hypothetical protein [Gammaproteobacteria bacterium]MBU0786867.1 hypothetical protein [Gammaproteobacteria bacterium]MBU0813927.1 hypothetical protein [Gammaproteobacteria bacterium]MBU1788600.1 hypothetical protein [Gammaproteobacteria bacterium]